MVSLPLPELEAQLKMPAKPQLNGTMIDKTKNLVFLIDIYDIVVRGMINR
jgi:hypothetical protein